MTQHAVGSVDATNTAALLHAHRPLLLRVVRELGVPIKDREDALQGAALGFLEAHARFDPAKGVTIGAYAKGFVFKEVRRATNQTRRWLEAGPLSDQCDGDLIETDLIDQSELGPVDRVELSLDHEAVRAAMKELGAEEHYIYQRLFVDEASQVTVANELGITAMSMSRRKQALFAKLRRRLEPLLSAAA